MKDAKEGLVLFVPKKEQKFYFFVVETMVRYSFFIIYFTEPF